MNKSSETAFLVQLGREELKLVKLLGWDHPEVRKVQHQFKNAYQAVSAIRKAYQAPFSQQEDS